MKKIFNIQYLIFCIVLISYSLILYPSPVDAAAGCPANPQCPALSKEKKSALLPDCVYYEGDNSRLTGAGGATVVGQKGEKLTVEMCCGCRNVNVFIQLLVKSANWFFGIVGAAALIMFIYGGFRMLTAAGNPDAVKAGKDALIAAVIGLAIIFSAQLLMRFVLEQAVPKEKLGEKTGEELQIKGSTPIQQ